MSLKIGDIIVRPDPYTGQQIKRKITKIFIKNQEEVYTCELLTPAIGIVKHWSMTEKSIYKKYRKLVNDIEDD